MSKVVSKYRNQTMETARKDRAFHRARALLGALVGAAIPLAFGVSEHGLLLGRTIETASIFLGLALFCALIGAGVATKNFGSSSSRKLNDDDDQFWSEKEVHDQMTHQGLYTYRRDQ